MRVVVVDDDKLVSSSLKMILEVNSDIEVVAVGDDGSIAISLYREYKPDILLMDIRMRNVTGLEASEQILKEFPEARILLLTTFSDDEYIVRALSLGVKGYILKQNFESIVEIIRMVNKGQSVYGDEVITKVPTFIANVSGLDNNQDLNEREKEVVKLVADGLSNKEIAEKLFLSEGTVRNYISVILEKLQLRDRTQLAIYYYRGR